MNFALCPDRKAMNCVALFAGGGGLFLGMENAGFRPLFATDCDESSARTFALNRPDIPFIHKDIRRIERAEVNRLVSGRPVHLVVGGPPCQGFSTIGDQRQGDVRNMLFTSMTRIVEWTNAECFLMENVSYLRSQYGGQYEREIVQSFEALGYVVRVATLNAADFGVPQVRQRAFFFGTRLEADFQWPKPSHSESVEMGTLPWATTGEAIMDLCALGGVAGVDVANHTALRHSDKVIRRYELIPEGGRLPPPSELPEDIRRKNFGNTYKRLHRGKPSLTLVPGNNAFPVHPTLNRSLTPREGARLQTFPDDYEFTGSRAQQCRLVGNAVPVKLAEAVGRSIAAHLASDDANPASAAAAPRVVLAARPRSALQEQDIDAKGAGKTAVSFFTGAGGLCLGFMRAGFSVLASYDRKRIVDQNLRLNYPQLRHIHEDITNASADSVRLVTSGRAIDVVFGGSPCQGFSIFGNRRFVNTRGHVPENDERNELTFTYLKIAVALSPRAIVLENVKGIASTPRGSSSYLDDANEFLLHNGYEVQWRILNCADYGVPQLRERCLLVATKPGIEFRWPEPKYHEKPQPWQRSYVTVGDVITDLMDPATVDQGFSHVPMNHQPLVVERYRLIPEGGRLPESDLPPHLLKGYRSARIKNFSHVYRRLAMDQPASTLVPGHNAFPVHPMLHRTLTVREAARIQTIPDSMRFIGTRQQQCMLVGNAVPPMLATVLAQALAKALDGVYADPGYKRDIYDLKAEALT